MKIRLVDKTIYTVSRAEIVNNRLEIDFTDKTAEEVQEIFSVPANLETIELLTDADEKFGELPSLNVYGGVLLNDETKTVILTKAIDVTEQRLTSAEANALSAKTEAEEAKTATDINATQITDLQLAVVEIYEGMEG